MRRSAHQPVRFSDCTHTCMVSYQSVVISSTGSGVALACHMVGSLSAWLEIPCGDLGRDIYLQGRWLLSRRLTWRPARRQLCRFTA